MTLNREEFIAGYVSRSGIEQHATSYGYDIDGRRAVALPCRCDEESCDGWAMVRPSGVRWHLHQNTDAEITDPTMIQTDDEGMALAEAFLLSLGEVK